jgi:hypothetical protein
MMSIRKGLFAALVAAAAPTLTVAQSLTPNPPTNLQVDGGGAVRSCPPLPAFPDASCTGPTPGVTLTIVTGDQTYGTSFNGQTISGKDFRGIVRVTGANITIKDSIFRGRAVSGNAGLIDTENSTGTITLQDIEVAPSNPSAGIDGMWLANTNVYRAHVHGGVDGIKTFGNVLIEDSYIHSMQWFANDPNQGGGETHNDGVQSWNGPPNTTLRHNRIDMSTTVDVLAPGSPSVPNRANATWQDSSPNSRAEFNWLDGGGCALNFAMSSVTSKIYVISNRFGRHTFYQCGIILNLTSALTQNTGNVWDDTGLPIPPPDQHN